MNRFNTDNSNDTDNEEENTNNEEIDKALKETFKLISEINVYIDNQAPWSLKKTDNQRMKNVYYLFSIFC